MASGIASPWGLTPQMVAGINNSLDYNQHHLTGELSLTSIPPTFNKDGQFTSVLYAQNKTFYTSDGKIAFGNKVKKGKRTMLKEVNKDIKILNKM
jgi:hypothetical protein